MAGICTKILLILVAFILPPLAVWIARDKICSGTVLINFLLCLLGFVSQKKKKRRKIVCLFADR